MGVGVGWVGMCVHLKKKKFYIFYHLVLILILCNRYRAFVKAKEDKCSLASMAVVPQGVSTEHRESSSCTFSATCPEMEYDYSHQSDPATTTQTTPASDKPPVSQEMNDFITYDPQLVYLCHRGYNHCTGKLSSKSSWK